VSTFFSSSYSSPTQLLLLQLPFTDQEFLREKLKSLFKTSQEEDEEASSKQQQRPRRKTRLKKTIFDNRFKKQICSWSENKKLTSSDAEVH
jgi:hypothetical protein